MGCRKFVRDIYCWVMAILSIGLIWLGWHMVGLTFYDRWYHDALMLHKSFGVIVLLLVLIKTGWMLYTGVTQSSSPVISFNRISTHPAFYLLMGLITISGYLISTSAGASISIFGIFGMPPIVTVGDGTRAIAIGLHYYLSYGTALLILLHALIRAKPHLTRFTNGLP
ncbi:MAG: cytochrome b [Thermodesulfobacteriota bacterium]